MKTTARIIVTALVVATMSTLVATDAFSRHRGHGFGPRHISSYSYVPATVYGGTSLYVCDPGTVYTYGPMYGSYGFWPVRHRPWRPMHRW